MSGQSKLNCWQLGHFQSLYSSGGSCKQYCLLGQAECFMQSKTPGSLNSILLVCVMQVRFGTQRSVCWSPKRISLKSQVGAMSSMSPPTRLVSHTLHYKQQRACVPCWQSGQAWSQWQHTNCSTYKHFLVAAVAACVPVH